jgi:hypothetical protein
MFHAPVKVGKFAVVDTPQFEIIGNVAHGSGAAGQVKLKLILVFPECSGSKAM